MIDFLPELESDTASSDQINPTNPETIILHFNKGDSPG